MANKYNIYSALCYIMVFYLVKNKILFNLQGIYNIILVRNIEMSQK